MAIESAGSHRDRTTCLAWHQFWWLRSSQLAPPTDPNLCTLLIGLVASVWQSAKPKSLLGTARESDQRCHSERQLVTAQTGQELRQFSMLSVIETRELVVATRSNPRRVAINSALWIVLDLRQHFTPIQRG